MLNIIDSILRALHINLGKLVKGANSVRSLVEPLLYNAGVCDEKAVLPIYPVADAGDPEAVALREAAKKARPLPLPEQYPDTIRPSRKGVPAVLLARFALCFTSTF